MARSEHATNIQLAAAAQRAHVGAHFAKRGPVRRYAQAALIDWRRVSAAIDSAGIVLSERIGGLGDGASRSALEAIARAIAGDAADILIINHA